MQVIDNGLEAANVPYSYGFAIILLTLGVKVLTYPLSKQQVESTLAMQSLQPAIKSLQKKYAYDKERLQVRSQHWEAYPFLHSSAVVAGPVSILGGQTPSVLRREILAKQRARTQLLLQQQCTDERPVRFAVNVFRAMSQTSKLCKLQRVT